jgi:hypothetical protein
VDETVTIREAYEAMFAFLEKFYCNTGSDDVGSLLGSMSMLSEGGTADPAMWGEWEAAIRKAKQGQVDIELRIHPQD